MSSRRGRIEKSYRTSWGEIIHGFSRGNDGRWRIAQTGQKFTESNELAAVDRFKKLTQSQTPTATITIPITRVPMTPEEILDGWQKPTRQIDAIDIAPASISTTLDPDENLIERTADFHINEKSILDWVRRELIERPAEFAAKIGIPELAEFRRIKISQELALSTILESYKLQNSGKRSAVEAIKAFDRFINHTNAVNLSDLTAEQLISFREVIEKSKLSPSTKKAYYSRIKTIISSGLKNGLDAVQIRQALDRLKILHCKQQNNAKNPQPIAREDFHKLMTAANTNWRAILIVSLNLCLHLGECLNLQWSDIDMDKCVHVSKRSKTGIMRAACLWEETIDILKLLPRKSKYIFISQHGTKYNRQAAGNVFAEIRMRAGVNADVKFDSIRDGAYTVAANCGQDSERLSRLLAGHSNGMQDHYVSRNPEIVKPATDAVHRYYFGVNG
jgi:integrase